MYNNLRSLFAYYMQDYEIYESDLEPLDAYRGQHDISAQKSLVEEMERFLKEVEAGTKSNDDLVKMGIEYIPDRSFTWFRDAISYLKSKVADE